jgi:hypothetical protein
MEHTMEIQPRRNYFGIILLFLVVSLACTIPGFGPQEEEWPEPAPETDTISFTIPNYTVTLEPGNYVPGTFMLYRERVGDNYEVTIDGLQATKRTGDSFIWDGIVAQAVYAQYNLRLGSTNSPTALPVEGSVAVYIFSPNPQAASQLPAAIETAVHYPNIRIDYIVSPGRRIPGTNITYDGIVTSPAGLRQGQLSGLTGYPYLSQNDSFLWVGALHPNVALQYNLQVVALNEQGIRLVGEADLWTWRLPVPGR